MGTIPESHRDLLDADVGVLATVGNDGRPQLSAVWFLAEGDTIALSLNTARQKTKNLKANAVATLFILDRQNPYRYLEVRGTPPSSQTTTTPSPIALARSTRPTCASTTDRATGE
jgi:PPOX class probable F420-dependent enzyme